MAGPFWRGLSYIAGQKGMSTDVNSSSPTRGAIYSRRDLFMAQIFFAPLSENFLSIKFHTFSSRYLQ